MLRSLLSVLLPSVLLQVGLSACSGDIGAPSSSVLDRPGSGPVDGSGRVDDGSPRPSDDPRVEPPEEEPMFGEAIPPVARAVRLDAEGYGKAVSVLINGRPEGAEGFETPGWLSAPFGWTNPVDRFSTLHRSYVVDSNDFSRLQSNARQIALRFVEGLPDPACGDVGLEEAACQRQWLEEAGVRLWDRPVTEAELDGLLAVPGEGPPEEIFAFRVFALILSPHFVFRSERGLGAPVRDEVRSLDGYELARSLAFTLTGGPPDAELFEAAAGGLDTRDAYLSQVDRLLQSDAYEARVTRFLKEYFVFEKAATMPRDVSIEDYYDESIEGRDSARYRPERLVRDTEALLRHWVEDHRSQDFLRVLLTSDEAFLNRDTAFYYNAQSDSEELELVRLSGDAPRRGILSQPAWLVALSEPDHNSPIKRGLFIQESMLCGHVPDIPIEGVPALELEGKTLREALGDHLNAETSCGGCHQYLDPLALPLERFDLFGRYRTEEMGQPVNTSGVMAWSEGALDIEGAMTGPDDLIDRLAGSEQVTDCFAKHAFEFWFGREVADEEMPAVLRAAAAYRDEGGNFDALMRSMLTSPVFLHRRVIGEGE